MSAGDGIQILIGLAGLTLQIISMHRKKRARTQFQGQAPNNETTIRMPQSRKSSTGQTEQNTSNDESQKNENTDN